MDDKCEGVIMDEDNLLVQVCTEVSHVYANLCLGTKWLTDCCLGR